MSDSGFIVNFSFRNAEMRGMRVRVQRDENSIRVREETAE